MKVSGDKMYSQEEIDNLKIPSIFRALNFFRLQSNPSQKEANEKLDIAYAEATRYGIVQRFFKMLLHIGDVSRRHNILREMGIKSEAGGSQERIGFRRILNWMDNRAKHVLYANLDVWAEFTNYSNLWYYENRTDRYTGSFISIENSMLQDRAKVFAFIKSRIKKGKDISLIARHLPKPVSGNKRVKKTIIKENLDGKMFTVPPKYQGSWVKLNGELQDIHRFEVHTGDVVAFPRNITKKTKQRRVTINKWIGEFCEYMGWTLSEYKAFRKNQTSMEQKFSSQSILTMSKEETFEFFDKLTSGQRSRMYGILVYKHPVTGQLEAKEGKFRPIAELYIQWEKKQEKIAQGLRDAFVKGDDKTIAKLKKEFKVKSTGQKSIDLLKEAMNGRKTESVINNSYQAFVEKTPMDVGVFPVIDGSGSMTYYSEDGIKIFDIAATMAIFFSTRNPVPEFRDSYGWFSRSFKIIGKSKYVNTAPNPYMVNDRKYRQEKNIRVIDGSLPFTENLKNIKMANPGEISSTNMGAVINYFVDLVENKGYHVEDLPKALLFLSDNEHNTGAHPIDAVAVAEEKIGWSPLLIMWHIKSSTYGDTHMKEMMLKAGGLYITGFNEGVLTQIFQGIKTGRISPYTEFWAITDDKRYSVLRF